MSKIAKEKGSTLIISLIMLVPVTLIAVTMMQETKNQWVISRNQVDDLKYELALDQEVVYFLEDSSSVRKMSKNFVLQRQQLTECGRYHLGNSSNVLSQCNEQLYLLHGDIGSRKRYVLLQEPILHH